MIQLVTDCHTSCKPIGSLRGWSIGQLESNVIAGRALLGIFQLQVDCADVLFSLCKKKSYRVRVRQQPTVPADDWPQNTWSLLLSPAQWPENSVDGCCSNTQVVLNILIPETLTSLVLEQLFFLGDTQSRYELQVFAQANAAWLPVTKGILEPGISNERKAQLTNALVRILRRFLTPATIELLSL